MEQKLDQAFGLVSMAVPDTVDKPQTESGVLQEERRVAPKPTTLFLRPTTAERFRHETRRCGITQDGMLEVLLDCFAYMIQNNLVKLGVRQVITGIVPVPKIEFPRGTTKAKKEV